MDTNSSSIKKKIRRIKILHLDELGYGPGGEFTREQWRDLCLVKLLEGKNAFEAWQESLHIESIQNIQGTNKGFGFVVEYLDKTSSPLGDIYLPRCTLDFIGRDFSSIYESNQYKFTEKVLFSYSKFKSFAWFHEVIFEKDAHFENTVFNDEAWFLKARFEGRSDFTDAVFCQGATFTGAAFLMPTDFAGVNFSGLIAFHSVLFDDYANFEYAIFNNVGIFNESKFEKFIPNFIGVAYSARLEFSDSFFSKSDTLKNAANQLGFLKRLSDGHNQTDQALNFNALELNAKAKQPDASRLFKVFTWFYEKISDYGRSFGRPLEIYAYLLFLTFLIALEHSAYNAPRNYTQTGCEKYVWWIERVSWIEDKNCLVNSNSLKLTGIRAASEYTLYRAAGVLDFSDSDKQKKEVAQRLFGQEIEPWWMRIWGVFKAIVSTALLFLAALGLRNKYRIK